MSDKAKAAIRVLNQLGYTHHGGSDWRATVVDRPRMQRVIEFALRRFINHSYQLADAAAQDLEGEVFKPGTSETFLEDAKDAEKAVGHVAELLKLSAGVAIPEGWALVPVDPTCEMIDAYHEAEDAAYAGGSQHGVGICIAWNAMLAAAPSPDQQGKSNDL